VRGGHEGGDCEWARGREWGAAGLDLGGHEGGDDAGLHAVEQRRLACARSQGAGGGQGSRAARLRGGGGRGRGLPALSRPRMRMRALLPQSPSDPISAQNQPNMRADCRQQPPARPPASPRARLPLRPGGARAPTGRIRAESGPSSGGGRLTMYCTYG
jgi:hypothetical protein